MRVGAPENLFDWNYWLTTWPAEPVLLTRANAADGYPRALTPLSQDLILPFEDAGVRRFFEETLGAMRPSDAPLPYRARCGVTSTSTPTSWPTWAR